MLAELVSLLGLLDPYHKGKFSSTAPTSLSNTKAGKWQNQLPTVMPSGQVTLSGPVLLCYPGKRQDHLFGMLQQGGGTGIALLPGISGKRQQNGHLSLAPAIIQNTSSKASCLILMPLGQLACRLCGTGTDLLISSL